LFREVVGPLGVKLEAYQIDSACGCSHANDQNWQLAKKLVLCAVANHMSLVRHWNWIHLTPTAHLAIATRNHLPSTHPLCRILWPHVFGTQQSNYFGTLSQMTGADFGEIFSFTFEGMCRLFQKTHGQYRFITTDPFQDARDRGIDTPSFETPTQDNLEALFDVMRSHAESFVNLYYQNDANVRADQHVLAWLDELNALIPGNTGVNAGSLTCATLSNLIARFIYLVTAQHESVGAMLWNYQLWSHRQPVRVYQDGRREPLDVYQLLVNYNYLLNVKRTPLIRENGGYSYLAQGLPEPERNIVATCFHEFNDRLLTLQAEMEKDPWAVWKIYPKDLEAHINA
jgi:arachidonate 15-lipoxygenase